MLPDSSFPCYDSGRNRKAPGLWRPDQAAYFPGNDHALFTREKAANAARRPFPFYPGDVQMRDHCRLDWPRRSALGRAAAVTVVTAVAALATGCGGTAGPPHAAPPRP